MRGEGREKEKEEKGNLRKKASSHSQFSVSLLTQIAFMTLI